ncbi:5'-5'''-P-1-P-4-tetraphosphate phosphorylase 2 [Venturia nashicola]|nr:5'-5'''-P-1-P-4-tetraphosphate phosphorylase 2 [Venturia nashicola]
MDQNLHRSRSICKHLPAALPELVAAKYRAAKASADVAFAPSELAIIHTKGNLPFQLRFCPSLAKKPTPQIEEKPSDSKPKKNPFVDPEPALFVTHLPIENPSHFLVLNKFPIISHHFILATKEKKEQFAWLDVDDLLATYAVLREWEENSKDSGTDKLFAFFNCGPESGASQPHRHIQFLPNASMQEGMDTTGWENLSNIIAKQTIQGKVPELPIAWFGIGFAVEPNDKQLCEIYNELRLQASRATDGQGVSNMASGKPYSHNLAMTTSTMMLVPRQKDSSPVLTAEGNLPRSTTGEEKDWKVSLNGTIMAGTLMVKDKELFEYLRDDRSGAIDRVLAEACFPPIVVNKGSQKI